MVRECLVALRVNRNASYKSCANFAGLNRVYGYLPPTSRASPVSLFSFELCPLNSLLFIPLACVCLPCCLTANKIYKCSNHVPERVGRGFKFWKWYPIFTSVSLGHASKNGSPSPDRGAYTTLTDFGTY